MCVWIPVVSHVEATRKHPCTGDSDEAHFQKNGTFFLVTVKKSATRFSSTVKGRRRLFLGGKFGWQAGGNIGCADAEKSLSLYSRRSGRREMSVLHSLAPT